MRLDQLSNGEGKIWLNVASSHYAVEGFVNIDNHPMMFVLDHPVLLPFVPRRNRNMLDANREAQTKGRFLRHDCRKPLPTPDGTIDHILCSHFLEHVFPDEGLKILADFKRVLKPRATLHVIVPDLEAFARAYVEKRARGVGTAADEFIEATLLSTSSRGSWKARVMEAIGGFGLLHRWMYDRNSLRARIEQVGFEILETNETPSHDYRKGDGSVHIVARKPA